MALPDSLEHLEGAAYGPVALRISPEKVTEFVRATSDDPDRWIEYAPPSFAAALLFAIAPRFLWSDEVGRFSTVLVHSDQAFRWHGPLDIGVPVNVAASVARVRVRGAMNFVTLDLEVNRDDGAPLVSSVSNFLMGAELGGDPPSETREPPVGERAANEIPPSPGSGLRALKKSASRVDLVRYAGASGDFNPVHYDHDAARAAGLPGVVVHGLLMMAWMSQVAAAASPRPDPIAEMKVRFRNPLAPAAAAVVDGRRDDGQPSAKVALALESGGDSIVTGSATVKE